MSQCQSALLRNRPFLWSSPRLARREYDGVLDGQSLFDRVKRPVISDSDQTPEDSDIRLAGHDGGDFLLVPR